MLECGKYAQTLLAAVSLGRNKMSLGSDEKLDAQMHNENPLSSNDKFLEVFGFVFESWCGSATEIMES